MNSQEAKFILQAYRHNGGDANDPQIAEALAQAKRDPELAQWLEEDQKLFHLMSHAVQEIPVPADLKASIFAGRKIIQPTVWWQQPTWLAAAAALILLCALGSFWILDRGPQDMASLRSELTQYLDTELAQEGLEELSTNPVVLKAFLKGKSAPAAFRLPAGLADLPSMGCRIVSVGRQKVSLICFQGPGSSMVHLFVMNRPDWSEIPAEGAAPKLERSNSWMTASWAQDNKVFVMSTQGQEADLRKYL